MGYLADPTHLTGYEPKEFDKITSVDGDTTLINDPDHDSISDFSKTTRENTGLFGVPTVFETSVSHVSHGDFVFQRESKESTPRETIAREREREREKKRERERERERRFCDQCCKVDLKEESTEQY